MWQNEIADYGASHGGPDTWLACDPSLTDAGFAVFDPAQSLGDDLIASWHLRFARDATDASRCKLMAETISELDMVTRLTRIVVEVPTSLYVPRGRSLDVLKVLMPIGVVMGAAGWLKVTITALSVEEWKGRKTADKKAALHLANELYNLGLSNHNEAEAVLIGLAAMYPHGIRAAFELLHYQRPVTECRDIITSIGQSPHRAALLEEATKRAHLHTGRRRGRRIRS